MKKLRLLFLSLFIISLISIQTMFGANIGDFQSAGGNWGTLATWQTWNGTSWVASATIPDSNITTAVTVISGNVTVTTTTNISNVTVNSGATDRKSTRLNSSHLGISYAVFCLKK